MAMRPCNAPVIMALHEAHGEKLLAAMLAYLRPQLNGESEGFLTLLPLGFWHSHEHSDGRWTETARSGT